MYGLLFLVGYARPPRISLGDPLDYLICRWLRVVLSLDRASSIGAKVSYVMLP